MRLCYICKTEIKGCNGFVIARDWSDYLKGKRKNVRELCSRDVLKIELYLSKNNIDLESYLNDLLKE